MVKRLRDLLGGITLSHHHVKRDNCKYYGSRDVTFPIPSPSPSPSPVPMSKFTEGCLRSVK